MKRTRLRSMSRKRLAELHDRHTVRTVVFARDGGCIMRTMDGHRCAGPLTPHHLRKASAGGDYTPDNLVSLCARANTSVEDFPGWARLAGLVVRSGIDHETAAQWRREHGMVVR